MQNKKNKEEKNAEDSHHRHHHAHHNNYSSKHYPKPDVQNEVPLRPGTLAPDFTLRSTPDQSVSLQDFRGRPVILVFYPADFSPVCGDELALFNQILPEF